MRRDTVSGAVIWRLVLGVALLVGAAACGSTGGCQALSTRPVPGGFDPTHRVERAAQVRLSGTGVKFLETNFEGLVDSLLPGGLSIDMPPTGCSGGKQKLCCSGAPCTSEMAISNVKITPTPMSSLKLALRAAISTSKMRFEQFIGIDGIGFWVSCDVAFNSARSGKLDLGVNADVDFVVDPANSNRLRVTSGSAGITDFDKNDISITGGVHCKVANWLKGLFRSWIMDSLSGIVEGSIDSMLTDLPLEQEGRVDIGALLKGLSPAGISFGASRLLDFVVGAGGYAESEQGGLSLGVTGGFRAPIPDPCVPSCEAPGATCTPPALSGVRRALTLRGNNRPGGQPFDIGIGLHRKALDAAAYALYAGGGLCLDVSTSATVPLTSSMFSLLIPSLKGLTRGENRPMTLAVRPRNPPTVTLGRGAYHEESDGVVTIDEPLITVNARDFAADVYVQLEERMVRLFTVVGDLALPLMVFPDAEGKLQIMLGDLKNALSNVRVEDTDLIQEDPQAVADLFPTLIGLASSFLSGGFDPIGLPSVQGVELRLDESSFAAIEDN